MELVNRTAASKKPNCDGTDIGDSPEMTTVAESEAVKNG